jgi:hypothetical protein
MKNEIGVWIDHRKAVIVSIIGDLEETQTLESEMEKHVRFGGEAQKDSEEDQRDRKFTMHLNQYYDEVITFIKDANSILIMGPGEAKGELRKRFEKDSHVGKIIDIETVDKLTHQQISAKVRAYFSKMDH